MSHTNVRRAAVQSVRPPKRWSVGSKFLLAAFIFYLAGMVTAIHALGFFDVPWGRFPVWAPTLLLIAAFLNLHWRSPRLGWLIFLAGGVCVLTIFWSFMHQMNVVPKTHWLVFLRALLMYGCLVLTGVFQLRRVS